MNGLFGKKVDLAFELGFGNSKKSVLHSGKTFQIQLINQNKSGFYMVGRVFQQDNGQNYG